jgi:hypothetical protein
VAVAVLVGPGAVLASTAALGSGVDPEPVGATASPVATSITPDDIGGPSDSQGPPAGLGLVEGVVVDGAGAGVAGCFVSRKPLTPVLDPEIAIASEADGSFHLGLVPTEWILRVTCPNGATGQTDEPVVVPDQEIVHVIIVAIGGTPVSVAQDDLSTSNLGHVPYGDAQGVASGSATLTAPTTPAPPAPPADALPPSGDQAPPANVGIVKPIKVKSSITAKLSGRLLTVTVRAKGAKAPTGSKLIEVKVGKKVVTAKLAQGKAKVRVPKVKTGTRVKVTFVGTTGIKPATKLLTYRAA